MYIKDSIYIRKAYYNKKTCMLLTQSIHFATYYYITIRRVNVTV